MIQSLPKSGRHATNMRPNSDTTSKTSSRISEHNNKLPVANTCAIQPVPWSQQPLQRQPNSGIPRKCIKNAGETGTSSLSPLGLASSGDMNLTTVKGQPIIDSFGSDGRDDCGLVDWNDNLNCGFYRSPIRMWHFGSFICSSGIVPYAKPLACDSRGV